ncbi:MAG: glycosyltransferase family 4 protein [Gammaproteobacteria bacterium]|nr:glycosyltransferase family 4 protein [Gammaproteobacteria bacterium]
MRTQPLLLERPAQSRRIAVIAPSLDILGGQGVQAAALMAALQNDGFSVSFLPVNPRFPRALRWLRAVPYLRTVFNQILYHWQLRKIKDVDIVHLFSASYWSFLLSQAPAIEAAKRHGKPLILNYHSGEAEDHLRHWGARVHPWLRKVQKIVVPSLYLQDVFARHGYDAQIIPNMISLSQFRYRARSPLQPKLLSVRNLEPIYRIENTLAAFPLIRAILPQATLTIAGYGSLESTLRKQVSEHGLLGVTFVGRVEPENIAALYDQSDIFINSSVVDNQPVSILEAFAAGLPVVSTPTGDIAFMIREKQTGLLVPPDRPDALADAVLWLLAHQAEAVEIAGAARQEVEKYTWGNVRADWRQLFSGEPS